MDSTATRCRKYGPTLVAAFVAKGMPAVWPLAIARQESNFDPSACSMVAGDAARGGSFGLCQMSLRTALDYDPQVTKEKLLEPETNARIAALHCASLVKRFGLNLRDVAAAYNSGRGYDKCPPSTRDVYVPHVLSYAELYRDIADTIHREIQQA